MPNRVLRDWTDSETMHSLTSQAERFFVRLIMKADDFGCFHANPKLLKAALFPLSDEIRDLDVAKWLNECSAVGLVNVYKVEGKMFLQIIDFGQRLRQSRPKFPQPHEAQISKSEVDSNLPRVAGSGGKWRPESETESETEYESESETEPARVVGVPITDLKEYLSICDGLCQILGRKYEQPDKRMPALANFYSTIEVQADRIITTYGAEQALEQVRSYWKYCKQTETKMIQTDYKLAEKILSCDWVNLLDPEKAKHKQTDPYGEAWTKMAMFSREGFEKEYEHKLKTDPTFKKLYDEKLRNGGAVGSNTERRKSA